MRPKNASEYVPGDQFHSAGAKVYDRPLGWAVNKAAAGMAKVVYEAVHENIEEVGVRRGRGKDWATWVLSEEPGLAEGIFCTPFELMIDARMEANAAIGLHRHRDTEEAYYVLEGQITMTTVHTDGRESSATLNPGDVHVVTLDQGHFGVAGPEGVRFIAIAVRRK